MQFFPNSKSFVSILGVEIAWYAIIIMIGAAVALYLTMKDANRRGISSDDVEDIFFGALIFGLIGARLWFVLFYPDKTYFLQDPMRILAFRDGGLAIQGGLVGGALYAYYKCKKIGISFIDTADSAMPNMLIAQAIGRWGNFVNQEAFGEIVSKDYFRLFPQWFTEYMYINGEYRQPMFFYESVFNLIGFILIKFVLPKFRKMQRGDYIYSYLVWYGVVRFVIEHFRSDSLMFLGLKSAQLVSLIFIAVGLMGFIGLFRKKTDVNNSNSNDSKTEKDTLVLFDFDGTIGDTNPIIINSFAQVFAENAPHFELSEEIKLSFIGPTLIHSFTKYLGEEYDIDALVTRYKEINFQLQREQLEEIVNSTKLLETLQSKNYELGVVSSKMKDSLMLGLDILDFTKYLNIIIGGDEVSVPKPNPEGILSAKERVLPNAKYNYYVGDTPTDIKASKAAGFVSIAICTTPEFEQRLIAEQPDYLIYDLMDVVKIIEENEKWINMI